MRITILGWYGTETIGDRAILAGILHLFSIATNDDIYLQLGSLYPVLSERTWLEDKHFLYEITNEKLKKCEVFYSLNASVLKDYVGKSDWVVMGGGPLMDIDSLYMILYAFQLAKKKGIKTSLFGCGWEIITKPKYIECAKKIIRLSDVTIFRDSNSLIRASTYIGGNRKNSKGLLDPAFFAAQYYRNTHYPDNTNRYFAVNFRHLFIKDNPATGCFSFSYCVNIIEKLSQLADNYQIFLIPMHTFFKGGDDRIILNRISQHIHKPNIIVQNVPLSLEDTMYLYQNATICVGMRYHSIVLQTILNGKNYILDYTDSQNGKTINMLRELHLMSQMESRYIHPKMIKDLDFRIDVEKIDVSDNMLNLYKKQYVELLKSHMK